MKVLIILIIISLFLIGCTPQDCKTQGYILLAECPKCTTKEQPQVTQFNSSDNLRVYFIDVGQGDATLIKQGETEMLIDCGKNTMGPTIVSFLKEKGVKELDYLMISHLDSDHLGGCDDVLRGIKTHSVITNGNTRDTYSYEEVMDEINSPEGYREQLVTARRGDSWSIGPSTIEILQADNDFEDENQNSLVARLVYKNMEILFTGDCDKNCEDMLIDKDIKSDILKVAHHGTKFATDLDFIEKVNPELAIISVGRNDYGHPSSEVEDRLSQEGVIIHRTDKDGTISLSISNNGYEVS